jgi:serine/threonine protein kinase
MQNGSTPWKPLVGFDEPSPGDSGDLTVDRAERVSGPPAFPFGRYVIRERMGQGGMAEVFLAVAAGADGFEKPVVVKRLLPQFACRADVASLLSVEAKLMTRLVHPNIVQVIDFGHGDRNDYFLVMELVKGTDLGRLCRNYAARHTALPAPLTLYIVSQVLRGLAHVHETAAAVGQKLVHRDISPGNVLLSAFGEVKVTDFGVAFVASSASSASPEITDNYIVGNPAYMAPEQIEREPVDERADIYGAGAVLFQMLTGTRHERQPDGSPYAADLSDASRARLRHAARPAVVDLVERALARKTKDRFPAAREMTRCIEQAVAAGEPMATADALAALVTDFMQLEPSGSKPVIVLSAGPSDQLSTGTELRKIADSEGSRGFCISVQGNARSAAPTAKKARSFAGYSAGVRWASFATVVAGLVSLLLFRAYSHQTAFQPSTQTTQLALLPGPGSQEVVPPLRTPRSEGGGSDARRTMANENNGAILAANLERQLGSAHPIRRVEHAHSGHREAASRASTADVSVDCRGQLHVYAAHGWLVAGGPSIVQAPGRYEWPCGVYSLRMASRTNTLESRTMIVNIRQTSPEIVDLR